MKDGDRTVLQYQIMRYTRPYYTRDKMANRYFIGQVIGDKLCIDPKIMFPVVYYTGELNLEMS